MEPMLMFVPLSAPKSRWKSFVTGWCLQASVAGLVLALGAMLPQAAPQARRFVYTRLVAPVEPVMNAPRLVNSHPVVELQPVPETPTTARLIVPRRRREIRPEEEVKAPEIKIVSKSPELPRLPSPTLAEVVVTNRFRPPMDPMPAAAKPDAPVRTGGFGDPNGVPPTSGGKPGVIAAQGSRELIRGAGFGSGFGGTKSTAGAGMDGNGVVQSSGFDHQYADPAQKQVRAVVSEPGSPVEIIEKPKPVYTEEGRKHAVEGEVRLEVRFASDNRVYVLRVLEGLGFGLDEQAVRAAEQIKFKPAMHGGRAIDSTAIVHIVFELAS